MSKTYRDSMRMEKELRNDRMMTSSHRAVVAAAVADVLCVCEFVWCCSVQIHWVCWCSSAASREARSGWAKCNSPNHRENRLDAKVDDSRCRYRACVRRDVDRTHDVAAAVVVRRSDGDRRSDHLSSRTHRLREHNAICQSALLTVATYPDVKERYKSHM